ncbi:MAG TPA: B-box zinc finger protein, partial [Terriglobales bacterium]|nr:B-box zinc finger protein [Terriglobales bacterium]
MNCANHADASAVAYCRTCGKALCANCTRPVRGVIYCEDCLGAKMEGVPAGTPSGASGFVSGGFSSAATGQVPAPPPSVGSGSGPNPTVAGILAGFFPFGVGAVYTGQYAKGLAHLAIFGLLIAGANAGDSQHNDALSVICILGIMFFYVYQIIDAVRSAKAIQMAQPIPDPFGLASTFGGGAKIETSKIPMGAIVLILLGVLFLLHTLGLTEFGLDRFWPLILIFVGGWMFARNWGLLGPRPNPAQVKERLASRGFPEGMQNAFAAAAGCQCARCRTRRIMGPVIVFTIGVLFLLQNLHESGLGFHRTWPVILLVVGLVKLLQGSAS